MPNPSADAALVPLKLRRQQVRSARHTRFLMMGLLAGCSGGMSASRSDAGAGGAAGADAAMAVPADALASLNFSPDRLSFGTVDIVATRTDPPQVVTISNTGAVDAALTVSVGGAGFAIHATTCGEVLEAGSSCTVALVFKPTTEGVANGTLSVAKGFAISLVGSGWSPGPSMCSDRIDLGTVLVGASVPVTVRCAPLRAVTDFICVASGADLTADPVHTTCSAVLADGSPCTIAYVFRSDTPGVRSNALVCTSNGWLVTRVPVVAAVVTGPHPVFNPAALTFGAVVGESQTLIVQLTNTGGSTTGPLVPRINPDNIGELSIVASDCATPLAPLASCAITVAFAPTSPGSRAAVLALVDTSASDVVATATITASASYPDGPTISGTPDLGTVARGGASAPALFTVTNPGKAMSTVAVSSTDPAQFRIGDDTCSGRPLLAGTGTCTFSVTFAPGMNAALGVSRALVQVLSEGRNPGNLAVQATTVSPAILTMTPAEFRFDGIPLGTQSGEKVLILANRGDLSTGTLTLPQELEAGFVISSSTCTTALPPGATCTIGVKFTPAAIAEVKTILIVTSASGVNCTAMIWGTGRTPMPIEGWPRDVRGCGQPRIPDAGTDPTQCFADTAVGQADGGGPGRAAHAPVSFTVTAVSPYPGSSLETGDLSVTLGGADPRDFVLASNTCGRSMAPGQSCTFTVSFRPTASGVRKATIETTASNGGRTTVTVEAIGLVADGGA